MDRRSPAATALAAAARVDRRRRPRSTPTTRPAAGTSGALHLTADLDRAPGRARRRRHRRAAVGARHALVRTCSTTAASSPCARTATTSSSLIDTDGAVTPLRHRADRRDLHRGRARARACCSAAPAARLARRRCGCVDVDDPAAAELVARRAVAVGSRMDAAAPRRHASTGRTGPVHAFDYPPTNPDVDGARGRAARRTSSSCTAARPRTSGARHPARSRTSPAAASACSTSTTAARAATAAPTASACAGSGASSTSRMSSPPRRGLASRGRADAGAARDRRRLGGRLDGAVRARRHRTRSPPGISRYGVARPARALADDTHDFEARYLDGLIGPLPDAEELYIERSPLSHLGAVPRPAAARCRALDDPVVPPAQSEAIRDALAAHGIPHAYLRLRGRGPRLPARRERRASARGGARVPRRRSSASTRRACRALDLD